MRKKVVSVAEVREEEAAEALGPVVEWVGVVIVVGLFVWLMWLYFVPAFFGGVDESAYMLEAKQLAVTGQPVFRTESPLVFTSENMLERAPGEFVGKYPPGYPLMCAAGYRLGGVTGAMLVNPLLGVAAVVGIFVLLRGFVSPMLALAGTMTLALHPMSLLYATGAMSHMGETAFCVCGFAVLLRWSRRGGAWWALAGVFLLAYACSIRYTAALVGLPLMVLAAPRVVGLWRAKERRKVLREVAAMVAGGVAGLTPLLWYQWAAFGSPLATGYGMTKESSAFSFRWFTEHAWYCLVTLGRPGYGLVVLFPLALAWLVYAAVKDRSRGVFLASWIVPPLILYMSYYWFPSEEHKSNYVRFFYQLYPPIILAALLLVERLVRRRELMEKLAATAAGLIALATFAFSGARGHLDRTIALFSSEGAVLVNRHVPKGSAVLCDLNVSYFAVFATDAEVYSPDYFDANYVADIHGDMRPAANQVIDSLRERRFMALVGRGTQKELDGLLVALMARKAPTGMYLLTTQGRALSWRHQIGTGLEMVPIAESPYGPLLLRVSVRAKMVAGKGVVVGE